MVFSNEREIKTNSLPLPPRSSCDDYVLIDRRKLNASKSLRTQPPFTLIRYVCELPLEQMNDPSASIGEIGPMLTGDQSPHKENGKQKKAPHCKEQVHLMK